MAIDATTNNLMTNWALWRIQRERPGLAMSNAYAMGGTAAGGGNNGTIVLLDDDAFQVEMAVNAMADYLRQAVVEYWLKVEPIQKKAQRCGCPVRTFWSRLDRAHQQIHTFRRERYDREKREREAFRKGGFSLGF